MKLRIFFPILLLAAIPALANNSSEKEPSQNNEVSATEDLMREHGILNRLLLIYQEIAST